jgi:CheY-like chemotaxis protein
VLGLDGLAVAAAALEAACDPLGADQASAERAVALAKQLVAEGSETREERALHDVRGELGLLFGHVDWLRLEGLGGLTASQLESLDHIEAAGSRIAAIVGVDVRQRPIGPTTGSGATRAHVVVIEDDSATLALLEEKLVRLGATVRGAVDGVTGLKLARELQPDLVMLDLGLPDVDGREILRALGAEGHRVAVSSGDARVGLEQELRSLGAIAVLPKPVDDAALAEALGLVAELAVP